MALKQAELQLKAQTEANKSGEDPELAAQRHAMELQQAEQSHQQKLSHADQQAQMKMRQQMMKLVQPRPQPTNNPEGE